MNESSPMRTIADDNNSDIIRVVERLDTTLATIRREYLRKTSRSLGGGLFRWERFDLAAPAHVGGGGGPPHP